MLDFRNTNSLWASVLVETLVRSGVARAIISPGSRSTPLAFAFASHAAVDAIPVLDERSAAFFALGMAKASLRPTVLVCTSGTAAANYFPAIVEAYESGVPLLVLTADRPPELRACASGQTIDQQKLYGGYVQFYHELCVPELGEERWAYLRQTVSHAVHRTLTPQAGPVHLNVPFRDPLPPVDDGGVANEWRTRVLWPSFFQHVQPPDLLERAGDVLAVPADVHGVIVVGPSQPRAPTAFVTDVAALASRLGWPVLADGLSPVRNFAAEFSPIVTTYDTILRNPAVAARLKPDVVIAIGGWPTSKVLRGWLEESTASVYLLTDRYDNRDALHSRTRPLRSSMRSLLSTLPERTAANPYASMWQRYEVAVREQWDLRLGEMAELFEPKAAWLLSQHLPPETPVFVANSMPIRDVEYVWRPNNAAYRIYCNRGANGIDGTVSTALGVAHELSRPTVLLTGDLTLLHDTSALLLQSRLRASLTIVLINNDGGGIFEHLPVAQFNPPFERFFATPQQVDWPALCAAYHVQYRRCTSWREMIALLMELPTSGVRVIEVPTNRKSDAARRKTWFAEIAQQL